MIRRLSDAGGRATDRFRPTPKVATGRRRRIRATDRASDGDGKGDGQGVGRRRTLFFLIVSFGNGFKRSPAPAPKFLNRVELFFVLSFIIEHVDGTA